MNILPRDNAKLDVIFKEAHIPKLSELRGEYFVDMLTVLPSLRSFSHRKVFRTDADSGMVVGCNVLLGNLTCGHFFVVEAVCDFDGTRALLINYNTPRNILLGCVRDYIRQVEKNLYLGRFNMMLFGRPRFMGYFTLSGN